MLFRSDGRKYSAFQVPACGNSFGYRIVRVSRSATPFSEAHAVIKDVAPPISGLLFCGYPRAVLGAISAVHVYPLDGKPGGVAGLHSPASKSYKVLRPSLADRHAAPAVVLKVPASLVKAAVFQARPYSVKPGFSFAVLHSQLVSFCGCVAFEAAARFSLAPAETNAAHDAGISAVARAIPRDVGARVFGTGNNKKTPELKPGKINTFHGDYLCFSLSDKITRRHRSELRCFGSYPSRGHVYTRNKLKSKGAIL